MIAEFMPAGGRRKRATRKQIARVKRGGKIANAIKKQKEFHHKEYEIPQAEADLEKDLQEISNSPQAPSKKERSPSDKGDLGGLNRGVKKRGFWKSILNIFLFWKHD